MILMGHRGAKDEAPENTLAGFQHALTLGLKAVELDIHASRDGRLMVIHDPTLERTTNGAGQVNAFDCVELQKLDAGKNEKIPVLEEVFELLLSKDVQIQVEIKDQDTIAHLAPLFRSLSKSKQELLTIISFHHRWLTDWLKLCPSSKTATLLYGYPLDPAAIAKTVNASGLSFNIGFIDEQLVHACKSAGLSITGWNANTQEQLMKMQKLEIDFLATDIPKKCLSWL